jgi:hypothetical protein
MLVMRTSIVPSPPYITHIVLGLLLILALTGCTAPQIYSSSQHQVITLAPGNLEAHGLALITPSTITGLEEDKQALALTFANVLKQLKPGIPCITLSQALGQLNHNGLTNEYMRMFEDYRNTGIFNHDTLKKISSIVGARYLGQLKLAGFSQGTQGRWGVLGLRVVETKYARIRLFLQIWDSTDGSIAWEGVHELNYAYDTSAWRRYALSTRGHSTRSSSCAAGRRIDLGQFPHFSASSRRAVSAVS